MPGLRHAHKLQQLQYVIVYSPPGEYLNNKDTHRTTKPINLSGVDLINPKEDKETISF